MVTLAHIIYSNMILTAAFKMAYSFVYRYRVVLSVYLHSKYRPVQQAKEGGELFKHINKLLCALAGLE